MFTGIIQDIGTVTSIDKQGDWKLSIRTQKMSLSNTPIGASICCSGICLTVISKGVWDFQVQASMETLNKTTLMRWHEGTVINLEPALRMGDEMGGHIVTGHVDAVAYVTGKRKENDSLRLEFEAPTELRRFIAPKGSVVINGVSLTVNEADHACFGVNIIPHTQEKTTLGQLSVGDGVNFEVDMLARYIDRLINRE